MKDLASTLREEFESKDGLMLGPKRVLEIIEALEERDVVVNALNDHHFQHKKAWDVALKTSEAKFEYLRQRYDTLVASHNFSLGVCQEYLNQLSETEARINHLEDQLKMAKHNVMYELFIDCMNLVITEEYRLKFQNIFDKILHNERLEGGV